MAHLPVPNVLVMATEADFWGVDPDAATETLRSSLSEAGIVLPSLGVDPASPDFGLINLGRVRADVALRLADVIRRGGREA